MVKKTKVGTPSAWPRTSPHFLFFDGLPDFFASIPPSSFITLPIPVTSPSMKATHMSNASFALCPLPPRTSTTNLSADPHRLVLISPATILSGSPAYGESDLRYTGPRWSARKGASGLKNVTRRCCSGREHSWRQVGGGGSKGEVLDLRSCRWHPRSHPGRGREG